MNKKNSIKAYEREAAAKLERTYEADETAEAATDDEA